MLSRAKGYAMKPTAQQFWVSHRARFMHEHHESRLKSVFRVVYISKHSPTHPENHRSVTMHDGSKRGSVPLFDEKSQ
jgi:hypothetical protein